jgi:hypothetical protein
MRNLKARYTREDAVAEGRLLDVSYLNHKERNPFPTFVSVGLWNTCRRERRSRRRRGGCLRPEGPKLVSHGERLRQVITLLPLFRWLEKGKCGELTMYVDSIHWLRDPLALRVVVEPSKAHGRIITVLSEGERLDFRVPRPLHGGSFFAM